MQDRNYLYQSLALALALPAALFLCGYIPAFTWQGYTFKTIDVFGDIKTVDSTGLVLPDSATAEQPPRPMPDTCRPGMVCIEDYSEEGRMMAFFFEALQKAQNGTGVCRIGLFGDSFIEGDMMTADLRDTLQQTFGGYGVGFVPITSEVSQFRGTISHRFTGFQTYTIVNDRNKDFATGGLFSLPKNSNTVSYGAIRRQPHLSVFPSIRLFYRARGADQTAMYRFGESPEQALPLRATGALEVAELRDANVTEVTFRFPPSDSLALYGVSFESQSGVIVDNFGLRGHSGLSLSLISDKMHSRFDSLQQYGLIVLQYGLNVVNAKSSNFDWYVPRMVSVVRQIKDRFPKSSILIMGVPDRSVNQNGTYVTMPTIPAMIAAQRQIARETGVLFWDLYEAMGGHNSMVRFVDQKPSLANKDYTHLNHRGAKKMAHVFAEMLLFQYEAYQKPSPAAE